MKYNINAIVVLTKGNINRHDDDNRFYLYINDGSTSIVDVIYSKKSTCLIPHFKPIESYEVSINKTSIEDIPFDTLGQHVNTYIPQTPNDAVKFIWTDANNELVNLTKDDFLKLFPCFSDIGSHGVLNIKPCYWICGIDENVANGGYRRCVRHQFFGWYSQGYVAVFDEYGKETEIGTFPAVTETNDPVFDPIYMMANKTKFQVYASAFTNWSSDVCYPIQKLVGNHPDFWDICNLRFDEAMSIYKSIKETFKDRNGIPVIFNILGYRLNGNGLNNSSEYFMEVLTIPEE